MDWPTLVKGRSGPNEGDVVVTTHVAYRHPILQPHIAAGGPGWREKVMGTANPSGPFFRNAWLGRPMWGDM